MAAISATLIGLWFLGAVIVWLFIFPFLKSVCKGSVKNQTLRRIFVSGLLGVPIGLFLAQTFGPKLGESTTSTAAKVASSAMVSGTPSAGAPAAPMPMYNPFATPYPPAAAAPAPQPASSFITVGGQSFTADQLARAAMAAQKSYIGY